MPAGRTHLAFELGTLPLWVAAGAYLAIAQHDLVVFTLSYTTSSLLLSPDLDLPRTDPSCRWGPLRVLWCPYAHVFRHRGLSHSVLWGPLTRVGYLLGLAAAGWVVAAVLWDVDWPTPRLGGHLPAAAAGLYFPHLLHVMLDRAFTRRATAR